MENRSYAASILYGVISILLTTYLMLNILIAIVEESYFLSQKKNRYLDYLMWKNLQQHSKTNSANLGTDIVDSSAADKDKIDGGKDGGDDDSDEEEENEWLQSIYNTLSTRDAGQASGKGGLGGGGSVITLVSPNDLQISLAEEAAEMYILGKTHWEYSKMMDYLVEQLSHHKQQQSQPIATPDAAINPLHMPQQRQPQT
jgi:hypothetical protein